MHELDAYPWSQHDGLCKALCEPALWGCVLDDIGWRHHFKRVFKRRTSTPINVANDLQFGAEFAKTLASMRGRNELAQAFEQNLRKKSAIKFNAFLARELHAFLQKKHIEHIPNWVDSCENRRTAPQHSAYYLDIGKFEIWVTQLKLEDEIQIKNLALYGCSFAILQPEIAVKIRDVMLARSASIEHWLVGGATADTDMTTSASTSPGKNKERAATFTPQGSKSLVSNSPMSTRESLSNSNQPAEAELLATPIPPPSYETLPSATLPQNDEVARAGSEVTEYETAPITIPPVWSEPSPVSDLEFQRSGADAQLRTAATIVEAAQDTPEPQPGDAEPPDELLQLLRDHPDWTSELSIAGLRRGIQLLRERAMLWEQQLRAVDERCARVNSLLDEVKVLPWFVERPDCGPVNIANLGTMPEVVEYLATVERDVVRLMQKHVQLESLTLRLGNAPGPIVPIELRSLGAVADWLSERVNDANDELGRIHALELSVSEILERFSTADKRAAESLLEDATIAQLINIALFIAQGRPRTEIGKRYSSVAESLELLGLTISHISQKTAFNTITSALCQILIESKLSRDQRAEVLSSLTFADLRELSAVLPRIVPEVCQAIFAAAIASNQPDLLDYIEPLMPSPELHPACETVYRAAISDRRRALLVNIAAQLRTTPSAALAAAQNAEIREVRARLLDLIQRAPTMWGNYHRLRAVARVRYFMPLKDAIERGNVDDAAKQWARYGSLDDMVDHCIRAAKHLEVIEHSHRQQTRRYLADFESELIAWKRLQELPSAMKLETAKAIEALRTECLNDNDPNCAALLTTIESLLSDQTNTAQSFRNFGQKCEAGAKGEPLCANIA